MGKARDHGSYNNQEIPLQANLRVNICCKKVFVQVTALGMQGERNMHQFSQNY